MRFALFLTYGSSLAVWKDAGILERELSLYAEHAKSGVKLDIISYGNSDIEEKLIEPYPFINVHWNRRRLPLSIYSWWLIIAHSKALRQADIYKTNQLYGAHIAAICAKLWRKPVIVRQGYGHYEHRLEEFGKNSLQAKAAFTYEEEYNQKATLSVFTTVELARRAKERHNLHADKIKVIPNFIDIDIWTPAYSPSPLSDKMRFLFFGRFCEQKNLIALIKAATDLPIKFIFIGSGPLQEEIAKTAKLENVELEIKNRMPQFQIAEALREVDWFVLPSHYEGHPKALIEAMAFGIPVFGTRNPGIKEILEDKNFSVIAEGSQEGLRSGLKQCLDTSLAARKNMGEKARDWAIENYSLSKIAGKERNIILGLIKNARSTDC